MNSLSEMHGRRTMAQAVTICFILVVSVISVAGQIRIGGVSIGGAKKPEVKKPTPTTPSTTSGATNQPVISNGNGSHIGSSASATTKGPSPEVMHAFKTDVQPYMSGFNELWEMRDKTAKDWSPIPSVDSIRKTLEQCAAMAAIIQQKYPNIENVEGTRSWDDSVGDWRRLVEDREKIVKAYISAKAGVPLREKAKALDKARERVAGGRDFELPHDFDDRESAHAAVVKQFTPMFALVGMTMPDNSVFAVYDTALDALIAEEKKHAAERGWDATLHDPVIEAKVRTWMPRLGANTQVVKIGMRDATWEVNKNSLGIPEGRYRRGLVMYRKPGVDECVVAKFSFEQNYVGGGRYDAVANTSGFTYLVRLQTCK